MSSAFINSLGSSFGSLTTTQTKSQSRTKKKTTQSGKIVVKKNMTAQGYLIRMANAKSPAQVAGIIRAARADAANAITPYKKQTEEDNESNPSSSSDMTTPGSVIDVAVTADTGCAPADASSVDVSL